MRASGGYNRDDQVRYTVGCLVGAAAMIGTLILVALIAIALQPPTWVQVALGVGLAAGGGALTWLVATALGRSRPRPDESGPRPVEEASPPTR